MIKRKTFFFSFRHYVQYAMDTKKEIWFLLNHYFDYATIMRKMFFFFISLGRSLWKYLLTWSYIAYYITNGILPEKNMCNLKNFLSQEFQWSLTWFTFLFSALQKGHNTISCLEWDFTWYQTNWRSTHWKKNIRLF